MSPTRRWGCCLWNNATQQAFNSSSTRDVRLCTRYEGCPESIRPFWISREPVAWPGCNLAASQKRPYCAFMNSNSPVGLVSRQWDAVFWACVLCDRRIHNGRAGRYSSRQCANLVYSSRAGFFGKASHHSCLSAPLQRRFGSVRLLAFLKAKIAFESEEICQCNCHTVHKLSQRRLTADRLAPTEEWLFTDAQYGLLWLATKLHQGHATGSRDIQSG